MYIEENCHNGKICRAVIRKKRKKRNTVVHGLSLAHNPNGVRPPTFPTGGAFLLSVIQFQNGGRRSAVVSVEVRI